ncbi:ATP-dependent Clp protease proteolytic subunit [Parasutterella excrementihominis]
MTLTTRATLARSDTERDNFMSSAQAVEYGIIDGVFRKRSEQIIRKK